MFIDQLSKELALAKCSDPVTVRMDKDLRK